MSLPGLPKSSIAAALDKRVGDALFELGMSYGPDELLRALPGLVLRVRRRWPENVRPMPGGAHVEKPGVPMPKPSREYVEAEAPVMEAADALAHVIVEAYLDREKESGSGPLLSKTVIMHVTLVQAINAVFRLVGPMSRDGVVDGYGNAIAQMLAIPGATPQDVQDNFDAFRDRLPELFAWWKDAQFGAGVDLQTPPKSNQN